MRVCATNFGERKRCIYIVLPIQDDYIRNSFQLCHPPAPSRKNRGAVACRSFVNEHPTRHDTTETRPRRTTTSRPPARRTSDRPATAAAAAGPARAVADVATTVSYSMRALPASRTTDHRYSSHIGPPLSHCGWESVGHSLSAAGLVNWVWVHQKSKLLYCDRYFIGLTIVLTLNIVHCGSKIRHSVILSLWRLSLPECPTLSQCGWESGRRILSIYLCPLSIWLTLPRRVLSTMMLSIQAVLGLPRLRAPGIVPCVISPSLFPRGVAVVRWATQELDVSTQSSSLADGGSQMSTTTTRC